MTEKPVIHCREKARQLILLLLIGLLLLSAGCDGGGSPDYSAAIAEGQAAAREVMAETGANAVAIALTDSRKLIWSQGFGTAEVETGTAAADTTLFSMASTSKMFAAVAVMRLVDNWGVDIDRPFVDYVPAFRMDDPRFRDITVRMLLNHSSGLPGTDYRDVQTVAPRGDYLAQVLETQTHSRLKAAPGYTGVYCNDGFTLLEALVEAVTGKSYPQFVAEEIFTPLGMSRTRFALAPFPDGSFARVYVAGVPQPQDFLNAWASGGAYSTAGDMAAFARMFLGGGKVGRMRIISSGLVDAMAVDQTPGAFHPVRSEGFTFGLGWDTVMQPGLKAVGVKGWHKGGDTEKQHYGVSLLIAPEDDLAVVVMGVSGIISSTAEAVAERVMLKALAARSRIAFPQSLAARAPAVAPVPVGLLSGIAGEYAGDDGIFRLEPGPDGTLTLLTLADHPAAGGRLTPSWGLISTLTYREDGTFVNDAAPLDSLRVISEAGTRYLIRRHPGGFGHYLGESVFAQQVSAAGSHPAEAWRGRMAEQWLVVNDSPESIYWPRANPRLRIAAPPDSEGTDGEDGKIIVAPYEGALAYLDASDPDGLRAGMLRPAGRDLNDLEAYRVGAEEWLRFGSYLNRPLSTLPAFAGVPLALPAGTQGNAQWLAVPLGSTPRVVRVDNLRAWCSYDRSFSLTGYGRGDARLTLPAGDGEVAYLQVYGAAGGDIVVRPE